MAVTSNAFRDALGRFASGVTVVAALDSNAKPLGVTISAFCSLSLEPPLVLFCLDKDHPLAGALAPGVALAVNVLAEDQEALSRHFADSRGGRFGGVAHRSLANGCPALAGALAVLTAAVEEVRPGGDHAVVIARVEDARRDDGRPLLHFRGVYGRLAGPS